MRTIAVVGFTVGAYLSAVCFSIAFAGLMVAGPLAFISTRAADVLFGHCLEMVIVTGWAGVVCQTALAFSASWLARATRAGASLLLAQLEARRAQRELAFRASHQVWLAELFAAQDRGDHRQVVVLLEKEPTLSFENCPELGAQTKELLEAAWELANEVVITGDHESKPLGGIGLQAMEARRLLSQAKRRMAKR